MNNKIVMEEVCPASTSLLVGFGDSCDLGADSLRACWELDGREPQRVPNKSRMSSVRAGRLIREYIGFKAVTLRFLRSAQSAAIPTVEVTRWKDSGARRQVIDNLSTTVWDCFETCSRRLRRWFDWASSKLRFLFEFALCVVQQASTVLRLASEIFEKFPEHYGGSPELGDKLSGSVMRYCSKNGRLADTWRSLRKVEMTRREAFLVCFSVFLARTLSPALSLPKPCLSPTLALGKKHRLIGPFFGFLISFHMILFCVCLAHARQQGLGTPVATGVALSADSVKPLKIGDTIPEALWNTPMQMLKAGQEGSTTVRLSDYRGKLIILDFWATWCGPCLKMLPKSDSLQHSYKEDLAMLPITYQSKAEVLQVLKNKSNLALPFIINDTLLKKFFPHFYLPHYVWIGADGKVKAITDHYRLTDTSIREMLAEEATPSWSVKEDNVLNFERGQTLLDVFKSGVNLPMLSESILTGHIEGLPGGYEIIPNASDGHYKIVAINMPMVKLYALALGGGECYIGNNSMLLETSSKNQLMPTYKGDSIIQWAKSNTYCLEVSVPKADWKEAFVTMQEQLNRFFKNYQVKLEPITRKVIAMKKLAGFSNKIISTNLGKPHSTFSNYGFELKGKSLDLLIAQLNVIYMQHSPYPLVNATGMDKPVDLKIEAELASLKSLNKALQPYGLQFVEEEKTVQTLVFRDK